MSFGEDPPFVSTAPPGPRSRAIARDLEAYEAPGINTLATPAHAGAEPSSLCWAEARGANVRDLDGNVFVDLTSGFGVASVGHRNPDVVAALVDQSARLLHGLGDVHSHPLRSELARRLARLAPLPEPRVFFAISGAEAVEIALKTALASTRRPGVVAFEPSYHGLTLGALAVTARPGFRQPFADHLHPYVRHFPYGRLSRDLEEHLASGSVGAAIVEPIVGREGVLVPPRGWLPELADLCRRSGTLLVLDEIFTGFGRTGRLFAAEEETVTPDLLCCGKALGGGLPIAAVLAPKQVFSVWETPGEALHTATFVANPLACAASLAVLTVIERDGLVARARRLGDRLLARLESWPARYPELVEEVRGRGLLAGVVFRSAPAAKRFALEALLRGVILLSGGPEGRVAQIVPPLTIDETLLGQTLTLLEDVLAGSPNRPASA